MPTARSLTLTFRSIALLWKSTPLFILRRSQAAMSVPEASETDSFRPTVRDLSNDPGSVPLPQPDDLQAALDAEIAIHATLLTTIENIERRLDELSASVSPQDPTMCELRHALSELKARQSTLRMQLRSIHGLQRSGLGLAVDRFLEVRDESLIMEFAASAQVFDCVANATRIVVRQMMSLCKGIFGQGARVGRAWSEMREQLRAKLFDKDKEDEEGREAGEERGEEKPKGEEAEGENESEE